MTPDRENLLKKIRIVLVFFMMALLLSGITAFPVESELTWLTQRMSWLPLHLQQFLVYVRDAMGEMNRQYPQLAYGYDWLAFAHIVIAALFIGPIMDPVKNSFIISWGMFACVAIIPLAFICGQVRDIPLPWTLIDCSFGVFGIVPLWLVRRWTSGLAAGTML